MHIPRKYLVVAMALACGTLAVSAAGQTTNGANSAPPAQPPTQNLEPAETYESLIARFRANAPHGAMGDRHVIRLEITTISGDDIVPDAKTAAHWPWNSSLMTTTFTVSDDGTESMSRVTSMAIQGGGPSKMVDADLKRIMELAADLPDDHAHLPPRGRRLVVQVVRQNEILTRVYDKANAPDDVLEMLRLVGADVWPIFPFPDFHPDQEWKSGEIGYSGLAAIGFERKDTRALATSADGSLQALSTNDFGWFDPTVHVENLAKPQEASYRNYENSVLWIRNVATGAIVHQMYQPPAGSGSTVIYAAWFTPDRRYLVAMSKLPELQIYDTSTWERVDQIPRVPAGAVAFYPSPDWKHAVVAFNSGEVSVLEIPSGRGLARIDFGDNLQNAAWSPDSSQVAVVTTPSYVPNQPFRTHLRIWDATTGNLLHELWRREGTPHTEFEDLYWLPDGKYLLATGNMTGIWDTESGRYRGELVDSQPPGPNWGQFVLRRTRFYTRFYKMCNTGEVLMWNLDAAIHKIADFEASLPK